MAKSLQSLDAVCQTLEPKRLVVHQPAQVCRAKSEEGVHQEGVLMRKFRYLTDPHGGVPDGGIWACLDEKVMKEPHILQTEAVGSH